VNVSKDYEVAARFNFDSSGHGFLKANLKKPYGVKVLVNSRDHCGGTNVVVKVGPNESIHIVFV
jgi:hypothetical protein